MTVQKEVDKELGRFMLDLAKLTYVGIILVAVGAWAFEKKIGILEFSVTMVAAGVAEVIFLGLAIRLLRRAYQNKEEER